ncbi:dihydropyrimidinase [Mesorhizobium sp. WSM4976]|uniref:dihydropyrimidinase n=1 Tax=Mesorhizobium sp. WSM4976 TaxID=3038549 RepID=UPI002416291F|nr:dihydropyrimidinase [Mesorhizobium sp. WSM4976]MDG4892425.1 dihydropyrimidinase [Mesorhizobium sp. WSM4976]
MDTIIKNGTVVTAGMESAADVGIEGGKIVAIAANLDPSLAKRVVDAKGCYVIPGGVDVHTHLDTPVFNSVTADDFRTGTIAAACGGTTSIVDFCQQEIGQSLADALATWHGKAKDKACIDYGFHVIVVDLTDDVEAEMRKLPANGVSSFKLFMAYKGMLGIDDGALVRALDVAKDAGAVVMVHAENGDAADYLRKNALARGDVEPKFHAETRPPRVEAEATARAIALAEIVGTSIYIVHLTCEEALEELFNGRLRGVDALAETCTQYLYTTKEDLARPNFEGAKYVFTPPARSQKDQELLWRALAQGTLQTVSSDHSTWNWKGQKDMGKDDFTKIPNGAPGIEERLMMVYQGVRQGRMSMTQFVDMVSTRPARTFGLFPRKGTIAIGSDADVVIWDPEAKFKMTSAELHHNVDYTPYEGVDIQGAPRTVLLRGEEIVSDRQYVGQIGSGQFLKRKAFRGSNTI